jgi:3-deoxy-manno-octulosonate cytidylyltransferase (CMP-KDO synthetase)
MSFTVIVPARLASTRLPDKPLADIGGAPMVVRVAQRAARSRAREVVVATDHDSILKACRQHGVAALMTRADHASGSDRLAEACELLGLNDDAVVLNVQGDEPLIEPALIDACATLLAQRPDCVMATVAHAIHELADYINPNVVKVVLDAESRALLFSRAPLPWWREGSGATRAAPSPARRRCRASRLPCATSAFTPTAPVSCGAFRRCRWRRWNAPKRSNSCACCGTANASPCTSRRTRRVRVSIRRRTWSASGCCTPRADNPRRSPDHTTTHNEGTTR